MVPMDETIVSTLELDFGKVGVGGSKTLSFVVTNKGYPHGPQDITVSVSGFFTLGSGDDSFTLADYDDERTIEVTYSPEAVQVDDTAITLTTTATYAVGPIQILAEGLSCTYSLPPIYNNPAGVMKIDLIVDPNVPPLTIPETVKVLDIGELIELIDVSPGIVDVQNMKLALAEEYNATYPAGFWYSLIQGYPDYQVQFRFILEEDGTDTFFFWGKVYREDVQWPEHYISTAEDDVIRTVEVSLVSLVHSLKDVAIDDAITEMKNHAVNLDIEYVQSAPTHTNTFACVQIKAILASLAKLCFDQDYDEDAIQVRGDDIEFDDGAGDYASPMDFYVSTRATSPYRGFIEGETDQQKNPLYWPNQFSNAYDLMSAIALNFAWVVRHYYGKADGTYDAVTPANNLHRFEFLVRGRSFANFIIPEEGIVESTLHSDAVTRVKNIMVVDIHAGSEPFDDGTTPEVLTYRYDMQTTSAWSIGGAEQAWTPAYTMVDQNPPINEPPKWTEFNLQIGLQFVSGCWTYNGFPNLFFWDNWYRNPIRKSGTDGYLVLGGVEFMRFWDYAAGAWAQGNDIATALMAYFNRRFSAGRKMFERSYGSLKFTDGTTSHVNLKPMKRIQINDQLATENYYATEVRKDFKGNKSTVLWIQE